jgi:hypothetical protein
LIIHVLFISRVVFPPVSETRSHGIVALGGDLSTERLQLAYISGIFLGLKMENLSLGGHLIPEWFCFWMSWWFLKHAKHTEQEYFHGYFQSKF